MSSVPRCRLGLASGAQDSTVKALVAGWLYDRSLTALAVVVAITQAVALVILVRVVAQVRRRTV